MKQPFLKLIERVRRRWIVRRLVESASIGAAAGAGTVSLILIVALLSHARAPIAAASVPILGAVAGLIVSWIRRPTLGRVAGEIDSQFRFDDLLGTALRLRRTASDPMAVELIVERANASAMARSAGEFRCAMLSGRGWTAIALTFAASVTLQTLMPEERPRGSAPENSDPAAINAEARDDARLSSGLVRVAQSSVPSRSFDQVPDGREVATARGEAHPGEAIDRSTAPESGEAMGRTRAGAQARYDARPRVGTAVASNSNASEESLSADGGAEAPVDNGTNPANPTEAAVVAASDGTPIPPWQSKSWPAARDAALRQLDRGRIPDAYRDMIRAYFDPTR